MEALYTPQDIQQISGRLTSSWAFPLSPEPENETLRPALFSGFAQSLICGTYSGSGHTLYNTRVTPSEFIRVLHSVWGTFAESRHTCPIATTSMTRIPHHDILGTIMWHACRNPHTLHEFQRKYWSLLTDTPFTDVPLLVTSSLVPFTVSHYWPSFILNVHARWTTSSAGILNPGTRRSILIHKLTRFSLSISSTLVISAKIMSSPAIGYGWA